MAKLNLYGKMNLSFMFLYISLTKLAYFKIAKHPPPPVKFAMFLDGWFTKHQVEHV